MHFDIFPLGWLLISIAALLIVALFVWMMLSKSE